MSSKQLFSTTEVEVEGDIHSEWAIAMVLEIREAAWTLEGVLEDAQNNMLRDMEIEFDSFTKTVKEIKKQLSNMSLCILKTTTRLFRQVLILVMGRSQKLLEREIPPHSRSSQ